MTCRVALPHSEGLVGHRQALSEVLSQLQDAASFGDIEAFIYLLNHKKYRESIKLENDTLRKIIRACYSTGVPQKALHVVQSLYPKPSPKHFSLLLKECLAYGHIQEVDRVLKAREEAGYRPDAYTHTARISALGAMKQSVAAIAQLRAAMADPLCRDKIEIYNAAISACAKSGDWSGADYVWSLVESSASLMPDVVTVNAMIKVAGCTNKVDQVKAMYGNLEAYGLRPTSWTYTAVFSAASNCRMDDASWLIHVYNTMQVQPNDYILSSFFSAMSHTVSTKEHIDLVFDLLQNSRRDHALNDIAYTSFMTFLARQDMPDRAVDIWDAARKDQIHLSPHFFSSLFAACARANKSTSEALYNVAFDAFDEFSTWWLSLDPDTMSKETIFDSLAAHNAFLHFLGEHRQMDIALLIFESMKTHGPTPDVVTYNTMMSIMGSSKDVESALSLYWEMSESGLQPTEKTFGSLLHAFANVGDATAAKKIFDSLGDSNIVPNSILYTSFIHAAVRHGEIESLDLAFDLANEMRRYNVPLTDVTYGCLLVACEKQGDVSKAFELYQEACNGGVTPSDQMHNILISVCTRCGKLDDALDLVKGMARKNFNIQQHTMNSLTRALSIESPIRAARMMRLMQTMGMQPSRRTRLEVLKHCALSGDVAESLELYAVISKHQIDLDGPSGSALITSLCAAQKLEDAVHVYDKMMAMAWRGSQQGSSFKRSHLSKRAHEPNGSALAALAQAHAAAGLHQQAWKFYLQLRRKSKSLQEATLTHRRMFEAIIEGQCRVKNLKKALIVFDDWKSASSRVNSLQKYPPRLLGAIKYQSSSDLNASRNKSKQPKLSYLALAYLEASCNSDPEHSWRVYDVLAVMRAQKESKRESELAYPEKRSHHVYVDN